MYVCVRITSHRTLVTSYIVHNKPSFINTSELENPETKKCSFEMRRCALETLHASCVAPGPPVIWLEWLYRHTESQAVAQCVWGMCGLAWVVLVELVSLKKDKERTRCWNTQKVHISYLESYFRRLKTTFTHWSKKYVQSCARLKITERLFSFLHRFNAFIVNSEIYFNLSSMNVKVHCVCHIFTRSGWNQLSQEKPNSKGHGLGLLSTSKQSQHKLYEHPHLSCHRWVDQLQREDSKKANVCQVHHWQRS